VSLCVGVRGGEGVIYFVCAEAGDICGWVGGWVGGDERGRGMLGDVRD
jgi:hypothetical protein